MDQIKRKPLPDRTFSEDFKKDTGGDTNRVSTEIQKPPPVHRKKNIKLFGWELNRPVQPPYSDTSRYTSAKPTVGQRFDRVFPHYKKYWGMRRKIFLIVLAVILLLLLALIIGLAVGLSNRSSKTQNLPLPTNHQTHTGDLTYYSPGMGACGIVNSESDKIVAISHLVFDAAQVGSNPNSNPLCLKKIRVSRFNEQAGAQRSVDLIVTDRCVGCKATDIDTTTPVFDSLADHDKGRVVTTWAWLDVDL
ncbi:hypothetical protein E6O75_ATG03176 [Venturia nashicola]|uniref:RlpA-like protein double-psi beta-barrel domain-containing protein n=1 Tax=Venturia nashicola TaxID=86259 RepID=A0A4Z1PJI1_9PEZI|nr:hypothetical protein E6O75_ATG03176 [Venturia nashicola]